MCRHLFSWPLHKISDICIELTDHHVFQLRLDVFLFAPCNKLQENRAINRFIVKTKLVFVTEFVSVKTKLDCKILLFLLIVYHVRLQHFICLFLTMQEKDINLNLILALGRRNTPVSVFLGLVWLFSLKYLSKSSSDKFSKRLFSLVALSFCWSLDASDVSATISDTFPKSSMLTRNA